jgi:hypothetical protein
MDEFGGEGMGFVGLAVLSAIRARSPYSISLRRLIRLSEGLRAWAQVLPMQPRRADRQRIHPLVPR